MGGNNNGSNQPAPEKLDQLIPTEAVAQRTEARIEAVKLLNSTDSLLVFEESAWQNPGDPIQHLALMDHGMDVAADEHHLHHLAKAHGHGHGHHGGGDTADTTAVASAADLTTNPSLTLEAANNPALAAELAASNPALAAQLAASNPGMALELAMRNPSMALELAMQNPSMAAQLAAGNPALAAQLAAQNPGLQNPSLDKREV